MGKLQQKVILSKETACFHNLPLSLSLK